MRDNLIIQSIDDLPKVESIYTGILLEKFNKILLSTSERRMNIPDYISPIIVDGKRYCSWCGSGEPFTNRNRKYCSKLCGNSCFIFFNPQSLESLIVLLIKQKFKCNICGFDYFPYLQKAQNIRLLEIDRIAKSSIYSLEDIEKLYMNFKPTSYGTTCYFKELFLEEKDNRPEVDHIVPIAAGGQSLGLDNHQAICNKCHKEKTKIDLLSIAQYKSNK